MTQATQETNVKPLTPQEIALGRNTAKEIQRNLTHLGLCYKTKDGSVIEISFRGHGFTPDRRFWAGEIDMGSLPPRVSVRKLAHPETLHHLTAAMGVQVRKLNTVGLTYCIDQRPAPPLPERLTLDWNTLPPSHDSRGQPRYIFAVGQSVGGASHLSLLDANHMLIGGATQMGKTTFLNAMLSSLLRYKTDELSIAFVDPKGVEFNVWDGIPHQIAPIAEEACEALALFNALVDEMEGRRQTFKRVKARNLVQCNERLKAEGEKPLPMILVIVDELTDLSLVDDRIYIPLTRLASKGAAFGFTLVLSTQNPKFEHVPTSIRGNLSTRIAFYVSNATHSRVILGQNVNGRGAHQLPRVKGRFLLRYNLDLVEHQGFYVSDRISEIIANRLRASGRRPAQQLVLKSELPREQAMDETLPVMGADFEQPGGDLSSLTDVEWEVLRVAIDELEGRLSINPLFEAIKVEGIDYSSRDLRQLIDGLCKWNLDGVPLVVEPEFSNEPRRCSDELIERVAQYFGE